MNTSPLISKFRHSALIFSSQFFNDRPPEVPENISDRAQPHAPPDTHHEVVIPKKNCADASQFAYMTRKRLDILVTISVPPNVQYGRASLLFQSQNLDCHFAKSTFKSAAKLPIPASRVKIVTICPYGPYLSIPGQWSRSRCAYQLEKALGANSGTS